MSHGKFIFITAFCGLAFLFFAVNALINIEKKSTYVVTSKGLVKGGSCLAGMYVSWDGVNVLDENSRPITCTKKLRLTKEQFKNYKLN